MPPNTVVNAFYLTSSFFVANTGTGQNFFVGQINDPFPKPLDQYIYHLLTLFSGGGKRITGP